MAISEGGYRPSPDLSIFETRAVDATTARLLCIQEAIKKGFTPDNSWADWLKAGVKMVEDGGVVTPEWLEKFDQENAYI